MSAVPEVEVVARPAASGAAPERIEGRSIAEWRDEARRRLGLPDGPWFATGHQCECWHPGILAKNLWVQAMADREGGHAAHLVVDQDGFDGMFVEWPVRGDDGWWQVRGHRFGPDGGAAMAMHCPAFAPRHAEPGPGCPADAAAGLAGLHQALQQAAGSSDAAEQATRAMLAVASPVLPTPAVVRASRLLETTLGRRLLERMLEDPEACAAAFNSSLAAAPRAARALRVDGTRSELPVWLAGASGERVRATAPELRAAIDAGRTVLPRAFLMSAIARTALADRFTHGLGGGTYEQVTDRWMRRWLGWAPPGFDVVTATLRLPIEIPNAPPPAATPWRRAWCDPDLIDEGGSGPSASRRRLLEIIAAAPASDPRRRAAYRELVEERNSARLRRSTELESLQAAEVAAGARRLADELRARRTWCFALQPVAAISRLRDAVRSRLPRA